MVKNLVFLGGGIVHPIIRNKMFEILYQDQIFNELNEEASDELDEMRSDFSVFEVKNIESERPLLVSEKKLVFYTFTGTKINRTLQFLFKFSEIKNSLDDGTSSFDIYESKDEFLNKLNLISSNVDVIEEIITEELEKNTDSLITSKWGIYLPLKYQIEWMKQNYFDIKQTQEFLLNIIRIVENR